mgnify:CR=1 FL=1
MYLDIANFKTYKDAIELISLPNKTIHLSDINSNNETEINLKHVDCDTLNINFEPNINFENFAKSKITKAIDFIEIYIFNNKDSIAIIDNMRLHDDDLSVQQNKIMDRLVQIKNKLTSINNILLNYNTA